MRPQPKEYQSIDFEFNCMTKPKKTLHQKIADYCNTRGCDCTPLEIMKNYNIVPIEGTNVTYIIENSEKKALENMFGINSDNIKSMDKLDYLILNKQILQVGRISLPQSSSGRRRVLLTFLR